MIERPPSHNGALLSYMLYMLKPLHSTGRRLRNGFSFVGLTEALRHAATARVVG